MTLRRNGSRTQMTARGIKNDCCSKSIIFLPHVKYSLLLKCSRQTLPGIPFPVNFKFLPSRKPKVLVNNSHKKSRSQ